MQNAMQLIVILVSFLIRSRSVICFLALEQFNSDAFRNHEPNTPTPVYTIFNISGERVLLIDKSSEFKHFLRLFQLITREWAVLCSITDKGIWPFPPALRNYSDGFRECVKLSHTQDSSQN